MLTSNLFPPRHCMCAKSESHIHAHAASPASLTPYVTINARGRVFCTSLHTLRQYPNSLLDQLFTPPIQLPYVRGQYALDVDPTAFSLVLDTLRDGYTILPTNLAALAEFQGLARTFGVPILNVVTLNDNPVREESYTVECFDFEHVTYYGRLGFQVKTQTETSTMMSHLTRYQCVRALVLMAERENTVEGIDACAWIMMLL